MIIHSNFNSQTIHGPELCSELEDFLQKNKEEFESALIRDLSHINHRATNYNGIVIDSINHQSGNEYCMSYSYDWFVYNGCEDMNDQDIENDVVCFSISNNGEIEFDLTILEERTTYNEF